MDPQLIAAIRIAIVAVGGILVGRGLVSQETLNTVTDPIFLTAVLGGIAAMVSAGIGIYKKSRLNIIKDASKKLGSDGVIVTDEKTAKLIPAANVVGSLSEAETVAPAAAKKAPRHPAHPATPAANS